MISLLGETFIFVEGGSFEDFKARFINSREKKNIKVYVSWIKIIKEHTKISFITVKLTLANKILLL